MYFIDAKSNTVFVYSTFGDKATELFKIDAKLV